MNSIVKHWRSEVYNFKTLDTFTCNSEQVCNEIPQDSVLDVFLLLNL